MAAPTDDPHLHQEAFELLGHTLYESVHVYLEHRRDLGDDVGASGFLYPYLGSAQDEAVAIVDDVAASILAKVRDGEALREQRRRRASPTRSRRPPKRSARGWPRAAGC